MTIPGWEPRAGGQRRVPSVVRAVALATIGLVAVSCFALTVEAATGTDLSFGYRWRDLADGAVYENVTFASPAFDMPPDNGPPIGPFNIPFATGFWYYGTNYTQFWISDNGWLSFVDPAPGG